jgi:hypothetical protein
MIEDKNSGVQPADKQFPCLAIVVSHLDETYTGGLEVMLLRPGAGNDASSGQTIPVSYMSPFFGCTDDKYISPNNSQQSYGMWMVPPDVGSTVMVMFANGDISQGYWIGGIPSADKMNFMTPGIAATSNTTQSAISDGDNRPGRVPVNEYNKSDSEITASGDPTMFKKPPHSMMNVLQSQGLLMDDVRGITSSSARRETPSMVFGISTPGPFDKSSNAPTGLVGKTESAVNAFVSHLGGSTLVMDDGDDKFLRKTPASIGPAEYVALENGESGGDVGIPHNELVRIRTRTGHQILLHNSEDLIYIGNSKGTTWVEMTSNGKIDIYANDSVSIHTENDFNLTADRDINLNAGANINLNAGVNILATAPGIHLNSEDGMSKIPTRIPMHEPWAGHENLDPTKFTKENTKAVDVLGTVENPKAFGKYTATVDPFNRGRK